MLINLLLKLRVTHKHTVQFKALVVSSESIGTIRGSPAETNRCVPVHSDTPSTINTRRELAFNRCIFGFDRAAQAVVTGTPGAWAGATKHPLSESGGFKGIAEERAGVGVWRQERQWSVSARFRLREE